jgi:hypothetical protein
MMETNRLVPLSKTLTEPTAPLATAFANSQGCVLNESVRLPEIPWGRPSPRVRGSVEALGTEITPIKFTPLAGREAARSFDSIPVFCFSAAKGLGDLSSAISLASGLHLAFPDKQVELVLVDGLSPRPQLTPTVEKLRAMGVVIRQLSENEAKNYSASRLVSIQGIIPHTKGGGGDAFTNQLSAGLNIYVPEYDPGLQYWNPTGMGLNRLCRDRSDLLHIAVTSGFHEDALGLFFSAWADDPAPSMNRNELLDSLEIKKGSRLWRQMQATDWTIAYRNCYDFGRERLAHMLGEACGERKLARPVTILDFTNFNEWSIGEFEKHLDYPSKPDKTNGVYVRPLTFHGEDWRITEARGSCVVRLGKRASNVFQAALRLAQLPVEITGDASLTEAVALGLPFLHDAPPWKSSLQACLVTHAEDVLSLPSAEVFRGLYQDYRSHDPQLVLQYPEKERLYLSNRDKLLEIDDEYRASIGLRDFQGASQRMEARMKSLLFGARLESREEARTLSAWRSALGERWTNDLALELWALKRSFVLGSDYRAMEREEMRQFEVDFVSNPARWEAFHELRNKSRAELDLARNLRRLIDGLVQRHGLAL